MKTRATCDSTVLPRSPTDAPAPSGQRRCRIHPEHCHKWHAEAIRGCNVDQIAAITVVAHAPAHGRRCSRRKPAAASGIRASRMHAIMNVQLASSPAVASGPAEAALCLEPLASIWTRVYHPNMPDVARNFCAQSKPIPIRDQRQLEVEWARLARAVRLAPTMSLDFSRSNARGRSDLHSPKDARTSKTHEGPGMLQDRRGMSAASSPFRQNGDSSLAATCRSGIRQQIDGPGWPRAKLCINTRDLRGNARVPRAG